MCDLSVLLIRNGTPAQKEAHLTLFKRLLRNEGIHFRRVSDTHSLAHSMIRMRDATDMRRLMCKLPGRLTNLHRD